MTVRLQYELSPGDLPTGSGASEDEATFTVVASNPDPSTPVTLRGLSVTIMTGGAGDKLTNDPSGITPIAAEGWKLDKTKKADKTVEYVFVPEVGHGVVGKQGLAFTFYDITVNTQPGTTEITIKEGSAGNPTTKRKLTKFPSGWGAVTLFAEPPDVKFGDSTTLRWHGPDKATYTIEYIDYASGQVVSLPKQRQPAFGPSGQYPGQNDPPLKPARTTTYTLNVAEGPNLAQKQKTVTVKPPPPATPVIKSFTGHVEESRGRAVLVLRWETDAARCWLSDCAFELKPTGSLTVVPTEDSPLLMSYTLTAVRDVGTPDEKRAEARLEAVWTPRPVSGWDSSYSCNGHNAVSLSPDGRRAVVATNVGVTILELTTDPVSVAHHADFNGNLCSEAVFWPDGSKVYGMVAQQGFQVVNAFTGALIGPTLWPGVLKSCMAVSGGARLLLFTADDNGYIAVFNSALTQVGSVVVEGGVRYMAVSPDNTRLYLSCSGGNTVVTLDLTSDPITNLGSTQVGYAPQGIAVSPDGAWAAVACPHVTNEDIWVLDARKTPMKMSNDVGLKSPKYVAFAGYRIFATYEDERSPVKKVSVIELATGTPVVIGTATINIGDDEKLNGFAVTKDGVWLLASTTTTLTALRLQYQTAAATN